MKRPVFPLAKLCLIETGRTPSRVHSEYFGGDNVWVTISDLNDGIVFDSKEHITNEAVVRCGMRSFPAGTVLLGYKLSLGKLGIAGISLYTNEAIAALQPLPGVNIDNKYLFYALKTVDFLALCHGAVKGKCLNQASLRRIPIPLPSISEQKRIVEILDQADALRKKRAEADVKAARILPALFYKMFGDPATNPMGWPKVLIRDLVKPIERRDPAEQPNDQFIYIDISGVDGRSGTIIETKTLFGFEAPSRARQIVFKNDVIISTVRPYLRATALVPDEFDKQICSTGFCVLRTKEQNGFGFLYALSRLEWFTNLLNSRARGASYPAVSDKDILEIAIPRPEFLKIHKEFDTKVLKIMDLQKLRKRSASFLESLFSSLLHRAFSGNLTAKWREAHMKELLAEMEEQAKVLNASVEFKK